MGAGGVSPPPRPLASRTSASRQWTASPMATFCAVISSSARKTVMRCAGMPVCAVQMFSTKIYGAAAICRPDMPHTLRSPPGEIPKSCPRRRLRRLAPYGAAGTFWKPCAPGLPCGFAVLTPARIVLVVFAYAAPARPFLGVQGLASATGTRALPPRDPGFPSFRGKRRKTRKAQKNMRPLFFCCKPGM